MQALVLSILKLKNQDEFYCSPLTALPIEIPSFGEVKVGEIDKLKSILKMWDPNASGFRNLLLKNLHLSERPLLKDIVIQLMYVRKWYAVTTAKFSSDIEIKKIALNAKNAFEILNKPKTKVTLNASPQIHLKSIPHAVRYQPEMFTSKEIIFSNLLKKINQF